MLADLPVPFSPDAQGFGIAPNSTIRANQVCVYQPQTPAAPNAITLVAHDLRGPLTSLRLLVELIESYVVRRRPEKIVSCANRAHTIIDGLEDLLNSLLERVLKTGDPLGFEPKILDLDLIVQDAVASCQPMAEANSVSLLTEVTKPLKLHGDRQLLHQAIENLIGNAVKHSSVGMSVTCSLRQAANTAIFCIEDMGTGLTQSDIKNAFRPFTTLSSKTADKTRSWGLGLWIVRLIVEQHGGTITVSSGGPGKGTAFTINLPLNA